MSAAAYFQQNPDVAAAFSQNNYGLTPEQFAQTHFERFGQFEQRTSPPAAGLLAYLQTPGLSDQQIAAEINRLGVTTQEVARLTGVPVADVQSRLSAVAIAPTAAPTAAPVPTAAPTAAPTMAPPPRPIVPTPTAAPTAAPPRATVPVPTAAPTAAPTGGMNIRYFQQNPDVAAEYARNNLGMTPEQFAQAHYERFGQNEQRADPNILPFASATQGFAQNLNNYTSIPIGAQFNPNVVGGVGSPYSQIMRQMTPVGNPYATVLGGIPMGGYDPGIYDPNLLNNFVRQRAAELRAAGLPVPLGMDGGGDGPGGAGDGAGSASGDGGPGGAADGGSGPGDGPGTGAGWYMGGLIDRVSGKNPAGPDDGQINVQVGEYVVKKSSVNKYGKGLLDMINEGKIPAKKIKSLLD